MINDLKERHYKLLDDGGLDIHVNKVSTPAAAGFLFDRAGLVRLLTEHKISGTKTVNDFLKKKGIQYL